MRSKIVLHLPEDMRAALRQRTQAEGTSVSGVILPALEHYFTAKPAILAPLPPPGAALSVRLTPQAAQAIASRTHRATISAVARAAISAYIDNDRWQGQLVEVPIRCPEALVRDLRTAAESGGREALFVKAIARAMQHVAHQADSAPEQRTRYYQRCGYRWISTYRCYYHNGEDGLAIEKQL